MELSRKKEIVSRAWHDFFILGKEEIYGVDDLIKESWIRSKNYGVDLFNEIILDTDELEQQKSIHKHSNLIDIAKPYMVDLYNIIKKSDFMITLTDKKGYILETIIAPNILDNTNINTINLSEKRVGTNAMGTCLYLEKPVQTWAEEHCYTAFHSYTTSAAPIHDYNGELIGCIGITGFANILSSHTLGMAIAIAHAIENQINLSYSNIINQSIADGIIVINSQGDITSINKTALNILELKASEQIGKNIKDILKVPLDFNYIMEENLNFYNKRFTIDTNKNSTICELSVTNLKNNLESKGLVIVIKKVQDKSFNKYKDIKNNQLFSFEDIVGESSAIKETIKLAHIASNGNSNILIMGESGTGKELFAQSIHNNSPRKNKPFVAINCGALPVNLVESELFGYEEGAFTGAKKGGQPGKFELANGGTLFLDEIGDMPLSIQASLLRVIEDRKVVRVGGTKETNVDVMIITATNKNLYEAVKNNSFRADLFYRINVFTITLPPLRERKEDIEPLIGHFIKKYNNLFFSNVKGITKEALEIIKHYNWPGNVRELENIVERAVQIAQNQTIQVKDLPIYLQQNSKKNKAELNKEMTLIESKEYNTIVEILKSTHGNVKSTAEILGLSRATIYRKISKFGIDLDEYRN